jgi:hypothetical protein
LRRFGLQPKKPDLRALPAKLHLGLAKDHLYNNRLAAIAVGYRDFVLLVL